jgi:SAM-dependent methyltransferase
MPLSLHDEITRKYYETTANRGHCPTREYYDDCADGLKLRLGPWMPSDPSVQCLDLACGCGGISYLLEREGFQHTIGVDLCREELEQARQFVRGELAHADVLEYLQAMRSASVDFITAFNFLEHLNKDKLLSILQEARRVLRTGGSLVAMVPNAMSPFGGVTRHWDLTHEWAFTPNNFSQLAALTGFSSSVDFRECGPVAHGLVSGIRYLLWQLIHAGIAAWFLVEVANRRSTVYTMDMLVRLRV